MSNYSKVKDQNGLIRDMNSKAILNIDKQALDEHRQKRKVMRDLLSQGARIDKMETDITEIKSMLIELLKK